MHPCNHGSATRVVAAHPLDHDSGAPVWHDGSMGIETTPDPSATEREGLVATGRAALREADWIGADHAFSRALALAPGPDAREGLGKARYWQGHHREALAVLEQAHREHRDAGDARAAANVAIHLAQLHALVHGDGAAMTAWVEHAQRQVDAWPDPCPEAGWVELFRACIAADPDERRRRAAAAVDTGRRFGDAALEFDALGYLGQAHVEQGDVATGMGLLDEAVAAATGGLVRDPWAIGEIWCTMFHACELVGDVHRADHWLATVDDYVGRTGELPIRAICRTHLGGVLLAAGRWDEAAGALGDARQVFAVTYRPSRVDPTARLADLRVRQGDLEDARRLLAGWEDHPAVALAHARLALAEGRPRVAADVLDRAVGDGRGVTVADAELLDLAVEVSVACGDHAAAAAARDRLAELATRTGHVAVRGRAALAAGRLAVATGDDPAGPYAAALSSLAAAGLPWELGCCRLEYAATLVTEQPDLALEHGQRALESLERLGAALADRAARLLRELGDPGRAQPRTAGDLTNRQGQVLSLLAEGMANAEIAERLCISPRTVEDHVGNILRTLGVDNRARAVAWAHRHDVPSSPR